MKPASSPSTAPASTSWIVIAAYNEGERLGLTLTKLFHSLRKCSEGKFQVVVVDDGSRDNTHSVAQQHPVWVLQHPLNCGQGAALRTGIGRSSLAPKSRFEGQLESNTLKHAAS
ncbi:Glycosyl transferase family 2 [Neorhodopirellula lusitana]|uniref:Glycosyl transferase family 2 n=1 Tax=Neorhodopirellula lusitana TaxID=445327 RepID=A0ABY1PQZ3_9BACT|nr:glycosyltransferase [Neorhodopirellula lusitana]SMP39364.1 Glycosyl transferase family 2 [Neorhodopirellula lusitana]